jgi:hypothetical protein
MFLSQRKNVFQPPISFFIIAFIFIMTINANIKVPISYGELADKITILEIKTMKIRDKKKLKNVKNELEHLKKIVEENIFLQSSTITLLKKKLKTVNTILWTIEDLIREQEYKKKFGREFIFLARCVYYINDVRGQLKRAINEECNSTIIEEKCYTKYK